MFLRLPRRRCNVCGWRGWGFASDGWHRGTICPGCGADVRHRLLVAVLDLPPERAFDSLIRGRDVLHVAPEARFARRFRGAARTYTTADWLDASCDLRLNLSAMPEIRDASWDTLIACDVLEHVPDDAAALREIRRILRPGGSALLTVPEAQSLAAKVELPLDATPAERLAKAGQQDHQRIYGRDLPAILREAGFEVRILDRSRFSRRLVRRHVLHPPHPSDHPLATNNRRVFHARPLPVATSA